MFTRNQICSLARRMLEGQSNAIVRHRLMRDVLRLPTGSPEMRTARNRVASHPWVLELAEEQLPEGTWGRFHSMDSKVKARFPTTEAAIHRALSLGLDKEFPILSRVVEFMRKVLEGSATWSDRVEKSEGWPLGMEAITAGTLARIDPTNQAILPAWEYWVKVAVLSFSAGNYDPSAEWQAHKKLRGLGLKYLSSRYVLTLLGARSANLPATIDRLIMDWIWNEPTGIGYLGADLQHPAAFHIFRWLESLEILSRFQNYREVASDALAWLWKQHDARNYWDFGTKASRSFTFPLSDDWRKAGNRSMDHSVQVLVLLRQFLGE